MTLPPRDLESRALPADAIPPRSDPASPSTSRATRERLQNAILAACRHHRKDGARRAADELRQAVRSYVAALRGEGATAEHAVISTKEILAETIGGPNIPPERRELAEQVVSWGIDAYYDSPARSD